MSVITIVHDADPFYVRYTVCSMRYISAIRAASIGTIGVIGLVAFVPAPASPVDVDIILTVSTFLFAILAGFYISRLGNRYDTIRQLVASEDAAMLCLYRAALFFPAAFVKKVRTAIDRYYIVSYDHSLSEYAYKQSAPYYFALWDAVRSLQSTTPDGAYEAMFTSLIDIEKSRNASSAIAQERLRVGEWSILLILIGIIGFCIFLLREPTIFSSMVTVLFSSALLLVLFLVRDLQNLMLGGGALLEESGQEVLEFLGLSRYYHESFLRTGISVVPKHVAVYRIGRHIPGAEVLEIETVRVKKTYR